MIRKKMEKERISFVKTGKITWLKTVDDHFELCQTEYEGQSYVFVSMKLNKDAEGNNCHAHNQ